MYSQTIIELWIWMDFFFWRILMGLTHFFSFFTFSSGVSTVQYVFNSCKVLFQSNKKLFFSWKCKLLKIVWGNSNSWHPYPILHPELSPFFELTLYRLFWQSFLPSVEYVITYKFKYEYAKNKHTKKLPVYSHGWAWKVKGVGWW